MPLVVVEWSSERSHQGQIPGHVQGGKRGVLDPLCQGSAGTRCLARGVPGLEGAGTQELELGEPVLGGAGTPARPLVLLCQGGMLVKGGSLDGRKERRKEMFYLMMYSMHYIFSHMTSNKW